MENPIPFLLGHFQRYGMWIDPRIVYQDVHTTEPVEGLILQVQYRGFIGHVGLYGQRLSAGGGNLTHHSFDPILFDIRKHKPRPLPGKTQRDGSPKSLGGPGYNSDFSLEPHDDYTITRPPLTCSVCPVMYALSGPTRK